MRASIQTGATAKKGSKDPGFAKPKTAMSIVPPETKVVKSVDRGPELERKLKELEVRITQAEKKEKQISEQLFEIDTKAREGIETGKRERDALMNRVDLMSKVTDRLQFEIFNDMDKAAEDVEREKSEAEKELEKKGINVVGKITTPVLAMFDVLDK